MKDQDKKVEHEFELVHVDGKPMQRVITKVIRACNSHVYATEADLIEVIIKTTGKKVMRCKYCERIKQENKIMRREELKKDKEELPDYYVTRTLRMGKTPIKDIPPALIEAKRAVMKIKNLAQKLEEPLKTCAKHGKLYQDDVIKSGVSRATGKQFWKCKKCMKEMHDKHYQLNKAKVLAAHTKYKKDNPQKAAAIKKKSFEKHKHKYYEKENARKKRFKLLNPEAYAARDKRRVETLEDSYVKKVLTNRTGLKNADIPQPLVECMRSIMQLKRRIKSNQNTTKIFDLKEKLDGSEKN